MTQFGLLILDASRSLPGAHTVKGLPGDRRVIAVLDGHASAAELLIGTDDSPGVIEFGERGAA